MASGFLGLGGPWRADFNLSLQLAMGIALLAGMGLARAGRFRAHQYCQMTVVLLNLALIFGVMAPSFGAQVRPHLDETLRSLYFAVPLIHAALGTVAEALGLYIVLSAGTSLLPESLRFANYTPWMRTTLALWWLVIALGIGIYVVWYRGTATRAAETPASPAHVLVTLRNFAFEPQAITIPAGTTVDWTDALGRHTVEFDDGSFKSSEMVAGGATSRRFDAPGTYTYHCGFHGGRGGSGMSGNVTVLAATEKGR
jgi:plastocyanin